TKSSASSMAWRIISSQSHRTDQGSSDGLQALRLVGLAMESRRNPTVLIREVPTVRGVRLQKVARHRRNPTVLIREVPTRWKESETRDFYQDRRNPTVLIREVPTTPCGREYRQPGIRSQSHRTDQGSSDVKRVDRSGVPSR